MVKLTRKPQIVVNANGTFSIMKRSWLYGTRIYDRFDGLWGRRYWYTSSIKTIEEARVVLNRAKGCFEVVT